MLEFCAEHAVTPDVEVIAIHGVNNAYMKIKNEDVRFRYVIDMASLNQKRMET